MFKTAKGILLVLFLYLGLVWAIAFYLHRTDPKLDIVGFGLQYTIWGFAVLIAALIGSWLFGAWSSYRARASARPKEIRSKDIKPAPAGHEDDEALRKLLREASSRLNQSPSFTKNELGPDMVLSGAPLYLVVGLEGSGKSSLIANSGLDAELLSGQPRLDKSSTSPTAMANVWLASGAVFIELGGRHFAGDGRRWAELMQVLAQKPRIPLWRRLWKGDVPGFNIRGIIHCSDLRFFISKPGPEQIERQSQLTQEKLRSVIKVFGRRLPVFTVFTKADQIPYFREFFGRFSEQEAEKILGCTLKFPESTESEQAYGTTEARRITKSLNALYLSLADRRLSVLFHEPIFVKKSKIYEFPREFNRIRQSLVDFLVQTFRPSPLEPTPVNRGFYFSGTREVEPLPSSAAETNFKGSETIAIPFQQALDATFVFKGDATEMMKGGDADMQVTRVRRGGLQTRWAFVSALFRDVVCIDRAADSFAPTVRGGRLENPRTTALVGVLCVSVLFAFFWAISWIRNASLVNDVQAASIGYTAPSNDREELPGLEQLKALDALRLQVNSLSDRKSSFWNLWNLTMRFGLYTVNDLTGPAREAYFRRLKASLLDVTNVRLGRYLQSLGNADNANLRRDATNRLKAYVMTTSPGICDPEPEVVAGALTEMTREAGLAANDERLPIVQDQFRYYANELRTSVPQVKLTADPAAQDHAINIVSRFSTKDQEYRQRVDKVGADLGGYVEFVPTRKGIVSVPTISISKAYTPDGWNRFEESLNSRKPDTGDSCIAKLIKKSPPVTVSNVSSDSQSNDSQNDVSESMKVQFQDAYSRDYLSSWREFLTSANIIAPFHNARDSAQSLEVLSASDSPLLGLLNFVAKNTTFRGLEPQPGGPSYVDPLKQFLGKMFEPPTGSLFTLHGVEDAFQPVRVTVPASGNSWVTEKNRPYIDSLHKLGQILDEIYQSESKNPDPQSYQKAKAAMTDVENAVDNLSIEFSPNAVGMLRDQVTRLLKSPVESVQATGVLNFDANANRTKTLNQQWTNFCGELSQSIFNKYPFVQTGNDLSLDVFTQWFKPEAGVFWTKLGFLKDTVKLGENKSWKPAPDANPTPELLTFLTKAQEISIEFFPDGKKLGFSYDLNPRLPANNTSQVIEFDIDGQSEKWGPGFRAALRQTFNWPAAPGTELKSLASGKTGTKDIRPSFTTGNGPWGLFKMLGNAQFAGNVATWTKDLDGRDLHVETQVFMTSPSTINMFERSFFSGLLPCPKAAVQK